MMEPIQLPEFYYLDNFNQLLDHVYEHSSSVLRPEDLQDYREFRSASKRAQALYTRCLMRKGWFFRPEKLRYVEIGCVEDCLKELEHIGFITWDASLEEKLPLFTKAELTALFPDEKLGNCARREMDTALIERGVEIGQPVFGIEKDFFVFRLLYFGNAYQDLSDFILNDLGIHQYERYALGEGHIRSTHELEAFLRFYEMAEAYDPEDPLAFHQTFEVMTSENRVLNRRLHKFYFRLARQLERMGYLDEALEAYAESRFSGERQARVLAAQERFPELEQHCLALVHSSHNEEECAFVRFFLAKHSRHFPNAYPKDPVFRPATETLRLEKSNRSVERGVCEYFSQQGACYYSENLWVTALFGLFFWEVIFADVPGAFSHPFQRRPHDLYEDDFCEQRREQIGEVLAGEFDWKNAERIFDAKFGLSNPFVVWPAVGKDVLKRALERFDQDQLRQIFEEFLKDLRNKAKGFPDLILFPDGGGVELIEVKGPGDRLQKHQTAWLQFFHAHGIQAKVVHVEWR